MSCDNTSSNAGIKLYIGDAADVPATFSDTAMAAITSYELIATAANVSARGTRRQIVEFMPLDGSVCKSAGSTNNGTLSFTVARIPEDAGQADVIAAAATKSVYPFKILHDDATATLTTPSAEYLTGIVVRAEEDAASDANTTATRTCEVAINNYVFDPRSA